MSDPAKALQQLLGGGSLKDTLFLPTSRYYGLEITTRTQKDGSVVAWVKRRFVPAAERFETLTEHVVDENDRLDRIAARHFGDPELFWRIADGNDAIRPDELTEEPGRRLRITLPEGVPGVKQA
jgi:hypothetical protein